MEKRFLHLADLRQSAARLRHQAMKLQNSISGRLLAGRSVAEEELTASLAVAAFANAAHEFYTRELRRLNAEVLDDVQKAHRKRHRSGEPDSS